MPAGGAISDAVRSLEWSAAVERASDVLPRARGVARYRGRDFFHDNRVAFAASLDASAPFPSCGVFVDHRTGVSMLVTDLRPRVRSVAAADVVVAGVMRSVEQLRFRSFYVAGERAAAARSLVVHQRFGPDVPTPLVAGARLQATLNGQTPFAVPRVLQAGLAKRLAADWVVEEALDGFPVPPAAAEATVHEVIELLAQTWQRLGTDHAPLDPDQRSRALTAIADLVEDPPAGCWPDELDQQHTWKPVRDLLTDQRPLTIGLSHGDPGLGNVLRLPDGRLALVDWEDAGRRPVAHDVVKALMSAPDPLVIAARLDAPAQLRRAISAAGAAPWRLQVATALLLFLSGWRNRHFRAVKRGSTKASNRRMHTLLRMLTLLLDEA